MSMIHPSKLNSSEAISNSMISGASIELFPLVKA